ncbi:MAG: hypothetical protein DWQ07_25320 [Chloroflexi bacterium]|nr:MAG: hypothetical protein DWQ07_25320 [Chloroflexota bacterium]MBL1196143.1 DNA double-strand break repair nuclease NurA [Chloroflexota bacterium]NOH13436.1 DNA double-strand break repair nuclease NurA [Chloroflexota bacterium]
MPVDFQSVNFQLKSLGEQARSQQRQIDAAKQQAEDLLAHYANQQAELKRKAEIAASQNAKLRCALPTDEALNASFPIPALPSQASIIAADGSQIYASRHEAVEYSLVNVGAVQFQLGNGDAPQRFTESALFYGYQSEAQVSQERDLRERQELARLAGDAPAPVITLTDGPLELWGGESEYAKALAKYLETLAQTQQLGATTAGYVDKPIEDFVVRLLEIASLPPEEAGRERPLRGVRDIFLFEDKLQPGERSAVFGIQSYSANKYEGELALHFFYLNVGRPGKPWLARVEIPAWVVNDQTMLNNLHAVLVEQATIMGVRPYPYILHRAHEEALVTFDEKRQIDALLARELEVYSEGSYKQALKDMSTEKTRYSL